MLSIKTVIMGTLILGITILGLNVFAHQQHQCSGDHSSHGHSNTEHKHTAQKTCTVMGGQINEDLLIDQDGERIYVCCAGCLGEVEGNFEKHSSKLRETNQGPEVVGSDIEQKTCPVMGGKINKDLYTEIDGRKIYVCCPGCIGQIEKNPEIYLSVMESVDSEEK